MKYGIKSILRTPVKTALFLLLLAAVSVFLSLGAGLWISARGMLADLDSAFLTSGELVFQGGYYPEADMYDPALADAAAEFDLAAVAALPGVTLAEPSLTHRAYIDGYSYPASEMTHGNFAQLCVEIIRWVAPSAVNEDGTITMIVSSGNVIVPVGGMPFYSANITDLLYSDTRNAKGNIQLFLPEGMDFQLEQRHTYFVAGVFFTLTGQNNSAFMVTSAYEVRSDSGAPAVEPPPAVVDVTGFADQADWDAFWQSETGRYYREMTDMFHVLNRSIDLVASGRVEAVDAFQRGESKLIDGAFFTDEDYRTGDACLISAELANAKGLAVGDTFEIHAHHETRETGLYTSYWPKNGFAHTGVYRVAGIYQTARTAPPVYIPYAGQDWLTHSNNDYVLGRVVAQNGMAAAVQAAARPLLPPQVTLSLYDQGYEEAARAPRAVREMATVITALSLAVGLVALFFFGYLFIYRSAVSAWILLQLGAGGRRVWLFLLSGAGCISAAAALLGGAAGYGAARWLTAQVYDYAVRAEGFDRRFSAGGFGAAVGELAPLRAPDAIVFLLVAAGVVAATLALCSLFARQAIRRKNPHLRHKKQAGADQKARTPRRAGGGRINLLPTAPLRYAARATARGGARFLVVTAAFALLLGFLCVLRGMGGQYARQLETVYDDIPVTVRYVDMSGRRIDRLAVQQNAAELLAGTEFAADSWWTVPVHYHYAGRVEGDQQLPESAWVQVPEEGTFAYETFVNQLKMRFDPLLLTEHPAYAPEFYYKGAQEIVWTEGWDLARYRAEGGMVVSSAFLEEHGLTPGDTVALQTFSWIEVRDQYSNFSYLREGQPTEVIVGSFFGHDKTVYTPFFNMVSVTWDGTTETITPIRWQGNGYYESAGILLQHTDRLGEFKDWLATQYDPLNLYSVHRRWVMVDDMALYQTIENLNRYLLYVNVLSPVLLAVAVGIGFLIANLLLRSRRREIALLRSLGQRRGGVFLALFWEQLWSCIPGVLLGVGGAVALLGGAAGIAWGPVCLFLLCYLAGAAAAIVQVGRVSVLAHLSEKEG